MVIRLTKATKFLCLCALLLVSVLISLSTRSITVHTPYAGEPQTVALLLYQSLGEEANALRGDDVAADMACLARDGYTPLSQEDLRAVLRSETKLPPRAVVLLFDDQAPAFTTEAKPVLEASALPWLPMTELTVILRDLQQAGYPVVRLERVAGVALPVQLAVA
ncbi:MAG: hypothetical protein LBC83_01605 [Oscillospiraceae bacterium]|jgi:hypothetical protein|nr:hypothetical protein [Oscillospiraceae bacterium]